MLIWPSENSWGWCAVTMNIAAMLLFSAVIFTTVVVVSRYFVRRPSDSSPPLPEVKPTTTSFIDD